MRPLPKSSQSAGARWVPGGNPGRGAGAPSAPVAGRRPPTGRVSVRGSACGWGAGVKRGRPVPLIVVTDGSEEPEEGADAPEADAGTQAHPEPEVEPAWGEDATGSWSYAPDAPGKELSRGPMAAEVARASGPPARVRPTQAGQWRWDVGAPVRYWDREQDRWRPAYVWERLASLRYRLQARGTPS